MTKRFGLLVYDTGNIGDDIQSLAARRFLPRVDDLVNRDAIVIDDAPAQEQVHLILNGWFMRVHEHTVWPPPNHIRPLITSLHISASASGVLLSEPGIAFLKQHAPIGARDLYTLGVLRDHGIGAFFSACLTLTLERPAVDRDAGLIVANELPGDILSRLVENSDKTVVCTSHGWQRCNDVATRFARAESLIAMYARASAVVTTRLHCAMACLAVETPVLLIRDAPDQERFSGLSSFVFNCTSDEMRAGKFYYDLDNPIPNPLTLLPYRRDLIRAVEAFVRDGAS